MTDDEIATITALWANALTAQHPGRHYGYDTGRGYFKMWMRSGTDSSRSVVAFVDRTSGKVYQPRSWKQRGHLIGTITGIAAKLADHEQQQLRRQAGHGRWGKL